MTVHRNTSWVRQQRPQDMASQAWHREQGCRGRRRGINTESLSGSEGTTTTCWGQPCLHPATVQDPCQPRRAVSPCSSKSAAQSGSMSPQSCPAQPWVLLSQVPPYAPHPGLPQSMPSPAGAHSSPGLPCSLARAVGQALSPACTALRQTSAMERSKLHTSSWTKLGLGITE